MKLLPSDDRFNFDNFITCLPMDNFNGAIFGSGQGSIAWRFWSTKTLDGIDQSPSCRSMVFLWSRILGIGLSATYSLSYEALWIHWKSIQSRLVRICNITWSRISWLENFYETHCNYFRCDSLYSRYWSKRWTLGFINYESCRESKISTRNFDQVESLYFGSGEIWPRGIFRIVVESCPPIGWSRSFSIQWCQSWTFLNSFMSR